MIVGFASAWRTVDTSVIAPVVGESADVARALIADLATGLHRRVRLDLDVRHAGLTAWAAARGLSPAPPTALMAYGGTPPGHRDALFAVVAALG